MSAPRMNALGLAWRFARRDFAAGEVRVVLAALMLAVAAVSAVAGLTDRAERALAMEANRLLGGDAVLRADQPIGEAPRALARELGLDLAEVQSFPSMVRAGEDLRLSDIRALSEGYPLRGEFRLLDGEGREFAAQGIPAPGEVWITRGGAQALQVGVGDSLKLGARELRIVALIAQEPDAALDYFNVAPKVSINLADLDSTGLVQVGSRIGYRLAVAGEAGAVQRWIGAQRAELGRVWRPWPMRGPSCARHWSAPTVFWASRPWSPWCCRRSRWRWRRAVTVPVIWMPARCCAASAQTRPPSSASSSASCWCWA
jgi:putative ABC transport system permease protein